MPKKSMIIMALLASMSTLAIAEETAPAQASSTLVSQSSPSKPLNTAYRLVDSALSLLGVKYRFGGSTPETGLDCSGFVSYVFRNSLGIALPRTSASIAAAGKVINREELQPGDLVFFNTRGPAYSHVGIYLGQNRFVHAPSSGGSVEVANLYDVYWSPRFNGARRVLAMGDHEMALDTQELAKMLPFIAAQK